MKVAPCLLHRDWEFPTKMSAQTSRRRPGGENLSFHLEGIDPALVELRGDENGIVWMEMKDEVGENAFSSTFVRALSDAMERVSRLASVNTVILTGTPRVFSIGTPRGMAERSRTRSSVPAELVLGRRLIEMPVPVVCAAEGDALDGGLVLLLSADAVVIARESSYGARFDVGSKTSTGSTRLLESVVSPKVARELLSGQDIRRGCFFEGMSGFNAIVPRNEVRRCARGIALRIAENPRDKLTLLKRGLSFPKVRALEEAMTLADLA
jgi:enoyl-CoA hydratase/carnithine racemase